MRVLHLCLSCFYIDDAEYQENHLVRQHVDDGHDVRVIASTEVFDGKGGLTFAKPGNYLGSDGARVVRLPYTKWLPQKMGWKLRIHEGVYKLIEEFEPAAILFHGCAGNEIVTAAKYAADHPDVLLYVDSHEDFNNSARSFISKNLLHRIFYRSRLRAALPHIRKVLCINMEAMEFVSRLYGVKKGQLEFFPLGGTPLRVEDVESRRAAAREKYDVPDMDVVFFQSGKITQRKKLDQSLDCFAQLEGDNLRFLVAGLLTEGCKQHLLAKIAADPRVQFLGWKTGDELTELLCAADVYLQPGTQSVTMQNALCCGCPAIIDDVVSHLPYLDAGVALVRDPATLLQTMRAALTWDRLAKREQALKFARKTLDYKRLATRVLRA